MSASFYDLLKYAATGIASPDMTYYDRMRASTLMGGVVRTLTGQPPLSFKADGTPLISWSMKGNTQQQGTPSPDNIIMPEMCGVRTGNLLDKDKFVFGKYIDASGNEATSSGSGSDALNHSDFIRVTPNTAYAINVPKSNPSNYPANNNAFCWFDSSKTLLYRDLFNSGTDKSTISASYTAPADAVYLVVNFRGTSVTTKYSMLNSGSTAADYEPYGWAEKITNAGQTVPVYLGQTQTVRRIKKLVFTGNESWNYSTQGNNTRAYTPQIAECLSLSPAICTHFAYNVANVGYPRKDEFVINSSKAIIFGIDGSVFTDKTAWTTYLQQQYAAGRPVTVWYVLDTEQTAIVNEPLAKIGDYADELHSEDAGVSIPTVKGQNVLTVDTPIQPSEMTITYRG